MKELAIKCNEASARFLDRRGYELVERTWEKDPKSPIDIVAKDEDALVFVQVKGREGSDTFPPENLNREKLEKFAIKWLREAEDDLTDFPIRFDVIAIITIGPDRAMIRHHINAMGVGDDLTEE